MANYMQAPDTISVNGLFLKFYLDAMTKMTDTFEDGNLESFTLFVFFLRACIPSAQRRAVIDMDMRELRRKIAAGDYGEVSKKHQNFIEGFAVVSGCVGFLDSALNITQNDGSALADSTDMNTLMQIEKLNLYKHASEIRNAEKRARIEMAIFKGEVRTTEDITELLKNVGETAEATPQDTVVNGGDEGDVPE